MAAKNKNKILFWIIGLGSAAWIISKLNPPITPEPTPPNPGTTPAANPFPIVYNKYSVKAKDLQAALGVTQDGIIGPRSLVALKGYYPEFTIAFKIENQTQLNSLINGIEYLKQVFNPSNYPAPTGYDRMIRGVLA